MSPRRGAMIGAGYFAGYQLDGWTRLDGVDIVAVADLEPSKAQALIGESTAPVYRDAVEMLDEQQPDFVDIVTPPASHHQLTMAAAERGIDVICQKPLAPTAAQAKALVDAVAETGVRFMVHENWRWQPWYRTVNQMLGDATVGQPHSLSFQLRLGDGWQPDAYLARQPYFRDYPRLLLFETGVHFVDTFRFLLGEVDSVYAVTRRRNSAIAGEDAAMVTFNFSSGAVAMFDASRFGESDAVEPRYTFGVMRLDTEGGNLQLDNDGQVTWTKLGQEPEVVLADPPRSGFGGDSILELQRHFLACVTSGEPFESEGRDYLKTIDVVEACYLSAETNSVVSLMS